MGAWVKWTGKQCQRNFLSHSFNLRKTWRWRWPQTALPESAEPQLMCTDLGWNVHFRLVHVLSHTVILPYLHAFLSWDAHTHVCHLNHTDIVGSITWREREWERERIHHWISTGKHPNSSDHFLLTQHHEDCVSKHSVKHTRLKKSILFWQTLLLNCKHSEWLKWKKIRVQSAEFLYRRQIMLNEVWKRGEAITSIRTPVCSSYRDLKQSLKLRGLRGTAGNYMHNNNDQNTQRQNKKKNNRRLHTTSTLIRRCYT